MSILSLATPAEATLPGKNGKLVFGFFDIFTINPDGTGFTDLTNTAPGTDEREPAWSPDGTKIAFSLNDPGSSNFDIYVMNADGSGQTNITRTPLLTEGQPSWSPDGLKIAFDRADSIFFLGTDRIWTMYADGTSQRQLIPSNSTFDESDFYPDWSPDGVRIAYEKNDLPSNTNEIWVVNSDGSQPTRLTPHDPGAKAYMPSWAPDGTRIAFVTQGDIATMTGDGRGQKNLTDGPVSGEWPAWSPDGTKIAFRRSDNFDGTATHLFTINPDATGLLDLTPDERVGPDYWTLDWGTSPASPPLPPLEQKPLARQPSNRQATTRQATTPFRAPPAKPVIVAKKIQKVTKMAVSIKLSEAGTVNATGTVGVPGASRTYRFKRVQRTVGANQRVRLRLKLGPKPLKAVKRALRRRSKVTAHVTVTATGRSGTRTVAKRKFGLKP